MNSGRVHCENPASDFVGKPKKTSENQKKRRISSDCFYCAFGPDFKFFVPNSRNSMPNLC